ncbi:N-acetylglucosamine-6-phosphate deacetylase [Flavitalea sp.]|nr:N-acetylglucosamine-6-phosphate deacetylase [Flavitalea sp.]
MNSITTKIYNATIITGDRLIDDGYLLIKDGIIVKIGRHDIELSEEDMAGDISSIDAKGNYLSPGFIDIHVHGGGGHDFMDGTEEAFLAIAALHARYGTTSMVPTTLTSDKASLLKTLEVYESANKKNKSGAQFLGLHFEGPYLAMSQRGAQDPKYIRDPDPAEYKEVLALSSSIKRWSAAPELTGAIEFGKYCRDSGVLPAIAHTDAIYEDVVEAFRNGFTLVTHLYSAMSGVTRRNAYRYAGVIESAYLIDEMDVELIADGIHMPAPLLKLAYKIKGADRIALITDAMRAAGMPEGDSILGNIETGLKVIVEDGVAKLPDRSSFAGSVATADRLVRTMVTIGEVPLVEVIKMITKTPARIMGVHETIGSIAVGMVADLVIFDKDINIKQTFIRGNSIGEVMSYEL